MKIKRFILICLACILPVFCVKAQNFNLGIKAGANLIKIEGEAFSKQFKLNYQAGFYSELDLTTFLGIQPELLFSQVEAKTIIADYLQDQDLKPLTTTESFRYLSIPLLLRFNVSKAITLHVGPEYSIALNKNSTLLDNVKQAFISNELRALAGGQLNIGVFRLYARYGIGVAEFSHITSSNKWKSQTIQAGVSLNLF